MFHSLSRLRHSFTRYGNYLPLPTSSPRGSVSAGSGTSSHQEKWHSPFNAPQRCRSNLRRFCQSLPPCRTLLLVLFVFVSGYLTANWLFGNSSHDTPSIYLISNDRYHRVFSSSPILDTASREILPIKAYEAFSDECVEEWVVRNSWGPHCKNTDLSEGLKINGVWAWVNGSDPAHVAARNIHRPSRPINVDAAHRYADHNELLYSMRSAYASFGPQTMTKMHIMASAYPLDDFNFSGQIPGWLRASPNGTVILHHDVEYFKPMDHADAASWDTSQKDAWRTDALPSFNSLAVESQLFNLDLNDADQLVYFNDDFFTMTQNTISDVTSPLYGPVIKTDTRPISFYWPSASPFQRLWNPAGEEVGIKRAGWVLGRRFSMRTLPYITHHPRSLWLPLLREAAQTFPDAFTNTALARFRAQKEVPTSIQAFFLASWYIVERHREALLWTWAIAKWAGAKEVMTMDIKAGMWAELVGSENIAELAQDSLRVRQPVRASPDNVGPFQASGIEQPQNTQYSFTSKDGHGLSYLDWTWFWQRKRNGYPDLNIYANKIGTHQETKAMPEACRIKKQICLRPEIEESGDSFFKRIAFERADCGDCIIAALMGATGHEGIEKFMPSQHASLIVPDSFDNLNSRAHLPLTEQWQSTNFSLSAIFPAIDSTNTEGRTILLRTWTARLIQRYQYVLGSTPSTFFKIEKANRLPSQLDSIEKTLQSQKPTTFLCLNDDIKENEQGTRSINQILRNWFQMHWPNKLPDEF